MSEQKSSLSKSEHCESVSAAISLSSHTGFFVVVKLGEWQLTARSANGLRTTAAFETSCFLTTLLAESKKKDEKQNSRYTYITKLLTFGLK